MAWLLTLFRSSTAWVFMGVVAFFLVYGSVQELKLNRAERQAAEWQKRAETAEATLQGMQDRLEALSLMLKEQEKNLDDALRRKNEKKRLLAEAGHEKAVADWNRVLVPDGVKRVLKGKKRK